VTISTLSTSACGIVLMSTQPVDRRADRAAAVEQDQGATFAEIAQAERVDARRAVRQVEARIGRLGRAGELRQLVDEVRDVVRRRGVLDVFLGQHRERRRVLEAVTADARAGDEDLAFIRGSGGLGRILRLRGRRGLRVRRAGDRQDAHAAEKRCLSLASTKLQPNCHMNPLSTVRPPIGGTGRSRSCGPAASASCVRCHFTDFRDGRCRAIPESVKASGASIV
jgi:hypothetical protein